MSSFDIICIPVKVFYQYRDATPVNEKTSTSYTELIARHACFSVVNQPYEQQHPRQNNKHRSHRSHHNHNSNSGYASSTSNTFGQNTTKRPKKPNDDPLAFFKGLLNVLNTSNFEKIQRKFKMAINDINIIHVCNLVLETAIQQAFFIDNYVRLLNGCRISYPQFNGLIAEYINGYIDNRQYIPLDTIHDDFVEQQKLKKEAIGRAILVIELLKIKIPSVSATNQVFAYYVVEALQETNDMQITDLLLSSLQEMKKRCRVTIDRNALKHVMFNHTDTRILFMFEQLL
jgi:hypothetical protein